MTTPFYSSARFSDEGVYFSCKYLLKQNLQCFKNTQEYLHNYILTLILFHFILHPYVIVLLIYPRRIVSLISKKLSYIFICVVLYQCHTINYDFLKKKY